MAKGLTRTQYTTLVAMQDGAPLVESNSLRHERTYYFVEQTKDAPDLPVRKPTFELLKEAGLIKLDAATFQERLKAMGRFTYHITDAGRAAIKAFGK